MNKIILFLLSFFTIGSSLSAQSNLEPALAYNLLKYENSGKFFVIGNFKVTGNPYLFGGKNKGSIYAKTEYQDKVSYSYNTYNQDIEFELPGGKSLVKNVSEVDSFIMRSDGEFYLSDLFFINASIVGLNEKCYLREVSKGTKFNLYKKYASKLEIPSTNFTQPDLRQFVLEVDYYYLNKETKQVKKMKISRKALINEFKPFKDLTEYLNDKNVNDRTEELLVQIFNQLNSN